MTDMQRPWVGVDLDGTLAHYEGWKGTEHIGAPIWPMVERIKLWLNEVIHRRLQAECGLPALAVTCTKDFAMVALWDDRAVQIIPNTGRRADGHGS